MDHPDGMRARDALQYLKNEVSLSPYEAGEYASGGQRLDKIVRFATVDCVKAGWMVKHLGSWIITGEGKEAYGRLGDPEAFYKEALRLYREWKAKRPSAEPGTLEEEAEGTSSKTAIITYEEADEQAWSEIEQFLKSINPYDLQELVASLLRAMGYYVSWVAPPGKDGGVDILASSDPLGTRPPRIKVQVKRQEQNIAVDGLRSFLALLGGDDVGLFVTTGGFTKDAWELARAQENRKITLLDVEQLFDLWVAHYAKLDDSARRRLPLKPIYFLAPEG
jgi:restriction system protein